MESIFKDPVLQEDFDKNGFVKVSLLEPEVAGQILQFYLDNEKEHQVTGAGYHTTTHTNNFSLSENVNEAITPIIANAAAKILVNFKTIQTTFIVKEPGEGSEVEYHQDWSFVDESKYVSVNIWVALQDMDEINGCLQVVPGSHNIAPMLRISPTYPWAFDKIRELLPYYTENIPAKMGEAIIFSHALVHSSQINKSDKVRVAAVLGVYSADADLLHFFRHTGDDNNHISKYKISPNAFMNMRHDEAPTRGEFQEFVAFNFNPITREEFIKYMNKKYGAEKGIRYRFQWLKRLIFKS